MRIEDIPNRKQKYNNNIVKVIVEKVHLIPTPTKSSTTNQDQMTCDIHRT